MASVSETLLIGHLGADPETRFMPDGRPTATVRLATTDKWKDKATGEPREHTEWHRVVFYDRLAEIVAEYCRKGSQIYVKGQNRTRKWTDKAGVERYSTEIRAKEMQMLGKAPAHETPDAPPSEVPPPGGEDDLGPDIPF